MSNINYPIENIEENKRLNQVYPEKTGKSNGKIIEYNKKNKKKSFFTLNSKKNSNSDHSNVFFIFKCEEKKEEKKIYNSFIRLLDSNFNELENMLITVSLINNSLNPIKKKMKEEAMSAMENQSHFHLLSRAEVKMRISEIASKLYFEVLNQEKMEQIFAYKITLLKKLIPQIKEFIKDTEGLTLEFREHIQNDLKDIDQNLGSSLNSISQFFSLLDNPYNSKFINAFFLNLAHQNYDIKEAEKALTYLRKWRAPSQYTYFEEKISRYFDAKINYDMILFTSFNWDETKRIKDSLLKVENWQIARSIFVTDLILHTLNINKEDIGFYINRAFQEGHQRHCISYLLDKIYVRMGLKENSSNFIDDQLNSLLNSAKEPFVGKDILFLASISGWSLCENMMRKLFYRLYSSYNVSQDKEFGSHCEIDIEDAHCFKVSTTKRFIISKHLDKRGDTLTPFAFFDVNWSVKSTSVNCSLNIVAAHPEMDVDISEEDNFVDENFIRESIIRIIRIENIKANSKEWLSLLEKLNASIPVEEVTRTIGPHPLQ